MLANRISNVLSERFKIPAPPTISATLAGSAQIAFSRFRNFESKPGSSTPPKREEAFILNVPLKIAKFSRVSIAGRGQSVLQSPGEAFLFDLTVANEVSLDATYDSIRMHLPTSAINAIAYDRGVHGVSGLYSKTLGQEDAILYGLAQAVLPAIMNPEEVTTAFVEYLALAVHDHVIHKYGHVPRISAPGGGLAGWQVRRAIDFIEANLSGDPSIAALSKECGLSESYFARAFRASMGSPPHQWIIKRRVERAKILLEQPDLTLVEIAYMCGFVDQSHLGRHFTRLEACTPADWRRRKSGRSSRL